MEWTRSAIDILEKEWPIKSGSEVGEILGCSKNAVIGKAHRLGLASGRKSFPNGKNFVFVGDHRTIDLAASIENMKTELACCEEKKSKLRERINRLKNQISGGVYLIEHKDDFPPQTGDE